MKTCRNRATEHKWMGNIGSKGGLERGMDRFPARRMRLAAQVVSKLAGRLMNSPATARSKRLRERGDSRLTPGQGTLERTRRPAQASELCERRKPRLGPPGRTQRTDAGKGRPNARKCCPIIAQTRDVKERGDARMITGAGKDAPVIRPKRNCKSLRYRAGEIFLSERCPLLFRLPLHSFLSIHPDETSPPFWPRR